MNKVLLPNLFLKSCSVLFVANTIFMTQSVPQAYAQHNSLSTIEQKTGWKLLFDGKTTSGWRNFRKDDIGSGWMVKDEALVRMSSGAGDIVTIDQYDSFELSIEYKISKAGNSGIMFHVTEESDSPWKTGPEIQIQDNVDGHDPQKSGWLFYKDCSRFDASGGAVESGHTQSDSRSVRDECQRNPVCDIQKRK